MDKDRIKGAVKQMHGSAKEVIGKAIGDRKTEAEGAAENMAGKMQSGFGKAKDKVRDTLRK